MAIDTAGTPQRSSKAASKINTSIPGTPSYSMAGVQSLSGAALYAAFMDTYHRRQRKPQPCYGPDAAGVTTEQIKVRKNPVKGKGVPPPDNYYPEYKPTKKFIPGRSFVSSQDLLWHNIRPLGMSLDSAMMAASLQGAEGAAGQRPMSAFTVRSCLRISDASHRSHMEGAGLTIVSEGPKQRPIRRPGTASAVANPKNTKERVMVLATPAPAAATTAAPPQHFITSFTNLAANSTKESQSAATWARHLYEAGLTSTPPRPSTAPTHAAGAMVTEARKRYHDASGANADVFCYRHSNGICPKEYKLDATRMPHPNLTTPKADQSRQAFFESRIGYATNRVRAILTAKPRYG